MNVNFPLLTFALILRSDKSAGITRGAGTGFPAGFLATPGVGFSTFSGVDPGPGVDPDSMDILLSS